ncbi:MAG TPA: hypothetical protein DEG43_02835 [Acidimicrobiaceae bacterium]|jgi:resuscitation-promoting factor RpfB|nr:hypothetical protein [Acidimicrobiaceae bacterium]
MIVICLDCRAHIARNERRTDMKPINRTTRAIAGATFLLAVAGLGCTPETQFLVAQGAAESQQAQQAQLASLSSANSLSDAQLYRLAKCESTNNPKARSKSGTYMGLYQFDQRTWNGVAKNTLPAYVGVAPSSAPAEVQDAMARALYSQRGRSPWPVCGRKM